MPRAKYCPSFDHLALKIFAPTLCFVTLLAVEDQSPKSPSVHDASWSQQGLCATTWIDSLCVYFKTPSPLLFQIITVLSAPPDANLEPSRP